MASLNDLLNPQPLDNNNLPIPQRNMRSLLGNYQIQQAQIAPINFGGGYALEPSKYDEGMPYEDIFNVQDYRGMAQPTLEKWANATGKMVGLTGTTFLQGTLGTVLGVGAVLATGKGSSFFNNEFGNALDTFNSYLEKELPNYYTQEELNASFGEKFFGSANFWADSIFKNLGFAVGAGLAGLATAGLGSTALGIKNLTQVSKAMLAASESGTSYAGLTGAALVKAIEAEGKTLARKGMINTLAAGTIGATGEASIEARHIVNDIKTELGNKILQEKAKALNTTPDMLSLTSEEESAIEKEALAAGNIGFGLNMALLTTGNLIHFGKAFSSGWRAEKAAIGDLVKKETGEYAIDKATTTLGKVGEKALKTGKYLKNPLWEATEEQLQLVASESSKDYALKSYDKDGATTTGDYLDSLMQGFGKAYGTQEGLENAFAGFIIGAFGIPGMGGGVLSDIKANKAKDAATKTILDRINASIKDKNLDKLFQSQVRNTAYEAEKAQHLASDDTFNYKNAEANQVISDLDAFIDADLFDTYLDNINSLKNNTPAEIREIFSQTKEDGTKILGFNNLSDEQLTAHVNNTIKKLTEFANQVKELKSNIGMRFPTASNELRGQVLQYAATIKNVDTRIEELSNELPGELANAVKEYNIKPTEENKTNLLNALKAADELDPTKDNKTIAEDLSKLYMRRDEFAKLYKSALAKPKKLDKEIQEAINAESINNIVSAFEDKEAANWWKENVSKDDHYIIDVPDETKPTTISTYTYTDDKGKEVSVDLWDVQEKVVNKGKENERVDIVGKWINSKGEESTWTIPKTATNLNKVDKQLPKSTRKAKVAIASKNDVKYLQELDEAGNPIKGSVFELKNYYKQINSTNTITKAFRDNEAKRKTRLTALQSLIVRKQQLLATKLAMLNNSKLAKLEEDYITFQIALESVNSKATTFKNPLTNSKIGVKQAKKYIEELENEYNTLLPIETALKEEVTKLQSELSILEKEYKTLEKEGIEVKSAKELIDEYKKDIEKIDYHVSKLSKYIEKLKTLIDNLYKLLGINQKEIDIRQAVENDYRYLDTKRERIHELSIEEFEQRAKELQQALKREKTLLGSIQEKTNQISYVTKAIDKAKEAKKDLLQNIDLLEQELAEIKVESEKVAKAAKAKEKIKDVNYDTTQDLNGTNVPTTNDDSSDNTAYSSPKPDISEMFWLSTGLHYIKPDNAPEGTRGTLNPDVNQQRWFRVTEKLDIYSDDYFVAFVTPDVADTLFPKEELFNQTEREAHNEKAPNIKVVLFTQDAQGNKTPFREDGKLVFSSTRNLAGVTIEQIDIENTNKPNSGFKYTNKHSYSKENIEANLKRAKDIRIGLNKDIAERAKENKLIFSSVVRATNGVSTGGYLATDPTFSAIGRVVPEGTPYHEIEMAVATSNTVSFVNTSAPAKPGVVYFKNLANKVIKGYSRLITRKEAENIIKLLMIFENRVKNGITDYSVKSTSGEQVSDNVLKLINDLLYYGKKADGTPALVRHNNGKLIFGNNQSIPFTLDALAKELEGGQLLTFIMQQQHHVNNKRLRADSNEDNIVPYFEVLDVQGEVVNVKQWDSYKEYLIAPRTNGEESPVGVKIAPLTEQQFQSVNLEFEEPKNNLKPIPWEVDAKLLQQAEEKKLSKSKKSKSYKKQSAEELTKAINKAKYWVKRFKKYKYSKSVFKKAKYSKAVNTLNKLQDKLKKLQSQSTEEGLAVEEKIIAEGTAAFKETFATETDTPGNLSYNTNVKKGNEDFFARARAKHEAKQAQKNSVTEDSQETTTSKTVENNTNTTHNTKEDTKKFFQRPKRLGEETQSKELENIARAKTWLNNVLPGVDFEVISNLHNSGVLGVFIDKCISISQNATKGTVAHEAFHAVYRMYLSPKEREAIHKELKTWKNYNELLAAKKEVYSGVTNEANISEEEKLLYLEEEILAEEFANYILLNGEYGKKTLTQKIKAFFRKLFELLGFIKKPSNVDKLFRNIDNAYYSTQVSTNTKYGSTIPYNLIANSSEVKFTTTEINAAMDAITGWMWDYAYGMSDEGASQLLNNLRDFNFIEFYNIVESIFEEYATKDPQEVGYLWKKINTSTESKSAIFKAHNAYLRSLGFNDVENPLDMDNMEESQKEAKDATNIINAVEIDTKSTMPNEVKFLLSSLHQVNKNGEDILHPELNLPKFVNFNKVYNRLAFNLAGIPTMEGMVKKLKEMSSKHREINQLLDILKLKQGSVYFGEEGFDMNGIDEGTFLLAKKFWQQMYKTHLDHDLLLYAPGGEIRLTNANTDTVIRKTIKSWQSNMMAIAAKATPKNLIYMENGKIAINLSKLAEAKTKYLGAHTMPSKLHFLGLLGIDMEITAKDLNDKEKKIFEDAISGISGTLAGVFSTSQDISNIFSEEANLRGHLDNLAELASKNSSTTMDLQYTGLNGQTIYNITLNSYVTHTINAFANKQNWKFIDNKYTTGSTWVNKLKKGKIKVRLLAGSKIQYDNNSGTETSKLTPGDNIAIKWNYILKGIYPIIRPSDKKLEYALDAGLFFNNSYTIDHQDVLTAFRNHLAGEIVRYLGDKKRVNTQTEVINTYEKNISKSALGMFHNIITNSTLLANIGALDLNSNEDIVAIANEFVNNPENKKLINKDITQYLSRQTEENKEMLLEHRLVDEMASGNYSNNAIIEDYFVSDPGIKAKLPKHQITEYQLNRLAQTFTINSLLSNMEQTRVLTGNVLMYSTMLKRTGGMVGTKLVAANDAYTNSYLESNPDEFDKKAINGVPQGHFKTVIYDDIKVKSNLYDAYTGKFVEVLSNQIIDPSLKGKITDYVADLLEPYFKMDEADGQGYITLPEYREFMIRIGKTWTPQHEVIYQKLMNPEEDIEVSPEDLLYFNPIKPQYFGYRAADEADGYYPPVFYKFSVAPLIPKVIKGTKLEALNTHLINTGTGIAVFDSGVKTGSTSLVGKEGALPRNFYNEDGSINTENLPSQILPYDFFGIQLEIAPHVKFKATYGTQKRKLTAFDLFQNGEIKALYINKFGSEEAAKAHAQQMLDEYHDIQYEIIESTFNSLLVELNIVKDKDSYEYTSLVNTIDILKDSLLQQSILENIYDSLGTLIDNQGNQIRYADTLPGFHKIESVIMNILNNRVIRQKVNGGMKIQVASSGFEKTGTQRVTFEKENIKGSNDLNFYEYNEETGTSLAEIKVPHYFKEFFELGQEVDIKSLDIRLLNIIGYRIPTDGLHSIEGLIIKEFLPIEAGDIIMLPTEIVAKAGSDYDIDKLTLILPNYKIKTDKDGNKTIKYISYLDETSTTLDRAKALLLSDPLKAKYIVQNYVTKYATSNKVEAAKTIIESIDTILKEYYENFTMDEVGTTIQDILDETAYREEKFEILAKKLADILEEEQYSILQQNTTKAIYNRSIQLDLEFIQAPENFINLISPVSTRPLQKWANYIQYLEEGNTGSSTSEDFKKWEENYDDKVSFTKFIEFKYLFEQGAYFQGGQQGVGIAALATTHHQLCQKAGVKVNNEFGTLNFDFGENSNIDTLSNSLDAYGYPISNTLSAMINAYTDIGKNPFIFKLNAFIDFANTFLYLLRRGVPTETVALFMKQPIISDYYRMLQSNKSNFLKSAEAGRRTKLTLSDDKIAEYLETIYLMKGGYTEVPSYDKTFSNQDLRLDIINKGSNIALQIKVLREFRNYKSQSEILSEVMKVQKYDTNPPGTILEAKNSLDAEDKVLEKAIDLFPGIDRVTPNTFLDAFAKVVKANYPIWRNWFFTENTKLDISDKVLDNTIRFLANNNNKADNLVRAIGKLKASFLTFVLQGTEFYHPMFAEVDPANNLGTIADFEKLLLNPNSEYSIAKRVREVQQDPDKKLQNNIFINNLIPLINNKEGLSAENIQFFNKKLTNFEANQLTKAFEEIANTDSDLARKLVYVQILTGLEVSPMNYTTNIPHTLYTDIIEPVIQQVTVSVLSKGDAYLENMAKEFMNQFYRNHMNDSRIVPKKNVKFIQGQDGQFFAINMRGEEFHMNLAFDAYSPYISVSLKEYGKYVRKLYRADSEYVNDKGGTTVVYVPSTQLGDGMFSQQYDSVLFKAVDRTWKLNTDNAGVKDDEYAYIPKGELANTPGYTPEDTEDEIPNEENSVSKTTTGGQMFQLTLGKYSTDANVGMAANVRDILIKSKAVDGEGNIKDYKKFVELHGYIKTLGYTKYGFPITTQYLTADKQGLTYTPERAVFWLMDAKDGIFYPENEHFRNSPALTTPGEIYISNTKSALDQLNNRMKEFFAKAGIKYNPTTKILDRNGNEVDAIAAADILKRTVDVIEGKMSADTLPEEAAHFFIEMLPQDHTLYQALRRKIEDTEIYQQTYLEYYTIYQGDTEKIAKEAMGKLIAASIVNSYRAAAWSDTLEEDITKNKTVLARIHDWIKNQFKKIINPTKEIQDAIDEFENAIVSVRNKILSGDVRDLLVNSQPSVNKGTPVQLTIPWDKLERTRVDMLNDLSDEDLSKYNITKEELSNMSDEKLGELLQKLCKSSKFGR